MYNSTYKARALLIKNRFKQIVQYDININKQKN